MTYVLLFALGFVAVTFFFWLATQIALDLVARLGAKHGWPQRPEHEMGVTFLAPLVVFVTFLLAYLIICLNRDHSFGTMFIEGFGPFALSAVVCLGWSRRSAVVWAAQMLSPGIVFAVLGWLVVGD